jgi:hypothetical protein
MAELGRGVVRGLWRYKITCTRAVSQDRPRLSSAVTSTPTLPYSSFQHNIHRFTMSLATLVSGAECGPANPLQGLTKNLDSDRGLQQVHTTRVYISCLL